MLACNVRTANHALRCPDDAVGGYELVQHEQMMCNARKWQHAKESATPQGEARTTRRTVISRPVVSTAVSNCFVTLKRICAVPLTSKQSRQDSTADTCCPVTTCAITARAAKLVIDG